MAENLGTWTELAPAHLPRAHVTVIIPTYNRPRYLRDALASVLAQTYQDFAVLVWNDGGAEEASTVARAFVDERIAYYRSPLHQGCMSAAINAWMAATGDLVAHLDDDDEWDPEYLNTLVPILDADPDLALAFCDHWITDAAGVINPQASDRNSRRWGRNVLRPGIHRPAVDLAVRGVIPTTRAAVVRRLSSANLCPPTGVKEGPDRWIAFVATRTGAGAVYVPKRLARARQHGGEVTKCVASVAALESEVRLTQTFLADVSSLEVSRQLRKGLAATSANWSIALVSERRGSDAQAAARLAVAVKVTRRTVLARLLTKLPLWLSGPAARLLRRSIAAWRIVRIRFEEMSREAHPMATVATSEAQFRWRRRSERGRT